MKTSEFIKRAKEYTFVKEENGVIILHKGGFTVGEVSTGYHNEYKITWIASNEEENLIREYAKTPLEDREEEKKYKVKCKITDLYLHHERLTTFDWVFGVDEKGYFTLKELEDLGINPEHYDLEEVE